jgi:hypothetical protein
MIDKMDHLILPENPIHGPVQVLLLSTENYDGGSWDGYPDRQGWVPRTVGHWQEIFQRPSTKFLAFLQRWLYFGVVESVLQEKIHISDFIQRGGDSDSSILTTERLPALVQRSMSHMTFRTTSSSARNLMGIFATAIRLHLSLSSNYGSRRMNLGSTESLATFIMITKFPDPRSPELALSIDLMMEFLSQSVSKQFGTVNSQPVTFGMSQPWTGDLWVRMRDDGWCPSELLVLHDQFDTSGLLFMNNLRRPNPTLCHRMIRIHGGLGGAEKTSIPPPAPSASLCNSYKCALRQLSDSTYQTRHTEDCSDCFDMVADPGELSAILTDGNVPLILSIDSGTTSPYIQLVPASDDVAYVAISHVWSDGLGNLQRNALPRCQLLRISNIIRNLPGKASDIFLFWIDTICVPPDAANQEEAQNLALQMMRRTYEDATTVLVFDSWLRSDARTHRSDVENLMRIFSSSWNTRLWTYQEGALAKLLYFQFQDGVYELDSGMERLNRTDDLVLNLTLKVNLNLRYTSLRGFWNSRLPLEDKLVALSNTLKYRSTSVVTDEALCLGSLLDLDVVKIAETEPLSRMRKFWTMLPKVPISILKYSGETLSSAGLRWAPHSLLLAASNKDPYMCYDDVAAQLTGRGLLFRAPAPALAFRTVQFPLGRRFMIRGEDGESFEIVCTFGEHKGAVLCLQDMNGEYIEGPSINPSLLYGSTEVAFIALAETENVGNANVGILAALCDEGEGIKYARKLCPAGCLRLTPPLNTASIQTLDRVFAGSSGRYQDAESGIDRRSGLLVVAMGKEIPTGQVWCID